MNVVLDLHYKEKQQLKDLRSVHQEVHVKEQLYKTPTPESIHEELELSI